MVVKWRTWRRWVKAAAVGLAAGSVVATAACSGGGASSAGSGPLTSVSKKPVTLTMWVLSSQDEYDWANQLVKGFENKYPNITVKIQKSAQVGDLKSVVSASVAHKLPDILFSADVFTQTESSRGMLLDVTPYMKAYGYKSSDFLGNIMDLGKYKGKQYVVPRAMDQVTTIYNPELFKKFGVPLPKQGWTWDELVNDCKKLTRKVDGKQYWCLGSGGNTYGSYPLYVPFMRGWGGDLTSGDKVTLTDPKVVEGVTQLMNFSRDYTPWFNPPPKDPFLAGQAAMEWTQRPVVFGCCINQTRTKWTSSFTPAFVNFPLLPTPKIGAGMAGWGASANTEHPHEAAAFLMYSLSKEGQQIYAKAGGDVPVRTDLKSDTSWKDAIPDGDKIDQTAFTAYAQYQSYPPTNLPVATNAQMSQALTTMWDSIRLKKASVPDALATAQQSIQQAMAAEPH